MDGGCVFVWLLFSSHSYRISDMLEFESFLGCSFHSDDATVCACVLVTSKDVKRGSAQTYLHGFKLAGNLDSLFLVHPS